MMSADAEMQTLKKYCESVFGVGESILTDAVAEEPVQVAASLLWGALRKMKTGKATPVGMAPVGVWKRAQLFANGQRCDDISEYGRCCYLYPLLKPQEWYRNKGITGFWEVGGAPAPIPAENFKDVLMAPTLIGMFQAGKFLPPQLNLVLELEFSEAADALRPGEGSTDYTIENVRVLASQVTLDSALYESYQKILLSGRSLVFAYPTMHTQVSSIPAGSTSFNVTVARAFTKLLGAFVTFRDADDLHPGDGSQFSANSLESQMQLGALQYPRYPMASDAEHFHFLEILAGTYDSSIKNMRIADNLWNNTQFICAFPVERVPKHPCP